jgi:hypothetical protein
VSDNQEFAGHLLIVDDNELNQDLLRARLEVEGFQVEVAGASFSHLPIVAMSAGFFSQQGHLWSEVNLLGFVDKPVNIDDVKNCVATLAAVA